jgi:hypothetical protein
MRYKKSWCAFFTAAAGTAITGITLITRFTQNNCPAIASQTVNMIQTVLEGRLPIGVHFGEDAAKPPFLTDDISLSFYLNLNKDLMESIKSAATNIMETSCTVTAWQYGMNDVLLALLILAAGCGVVCAFNYSQRDEHNPLQEVPDNDRVQPLIHNS